MKAICLLFSFLFLSIISWGQTILNPGDLVILGVDGNLGGNPDEISFACFKDITAGTEIQITDQGYERCYAGLWGSNEGGAKLVRTGGTITAGTVITFRTSQSYAPYIHFTYPDSLWSVANLGVGAPSNSFNLNTGGDQLYIAQGGTWTSGASCSNSYPGTGGRMLFAFSTSSPAWDSTFANSTQKSALYPGMSCYNMAPTGGASDWVKYIGPLTAATQKDWIARIGTTTYWKKYTSSALYLAGSPDLHTTVLPIIPGTDADWTSPGSLCQSSASINLNSLISGLGVTGGAWSGTGVTGNIFNPSGLSGMYNITYTIDCPCCISQTHTITVNANPVITAGSNTPLCSGTNLNLTTTGSGTYNWSGPNGFSSSSQNPIISPVTIAATGTYTVTVTSAGGCISTSSTTVLIHQTPSINAGQDTTIPAGTSTTIHASLTGGTGPFTYSWSPSGSLVNATVKNPTTTNLTVTTTYTVTITDQATGCTGTDQIVVNTSGGLLNVTSITVTPNSICKGGSTHLVANASGGSGNYTYAWSPASSLNNASIYNPIASPSGTTTYTISVNDGFNTVTDTLTVHVFPLPTPTAGSNSPVCEGQTLNLSSSPTGASSYNWSGPTGFSNVNQNPTLSSIALSAAGTYTVTVTDGNGCSAIAQTTVIVNNLPTPTASNNTPCEGQTLNLMSGGGTGYSWSGPNSFSNLNQNPSISNVQLSAAGTYTITVTNGNGCSATAQTVVSINSNPVANASSNKPCEGQTLNLTSNGGSNYSWSGPNGFSDANQNPTIQNATLSDTGTYIVTVTDGNGCFSTAQTIVVFNSNPTATASSNSAICESATLNLTSGGGTNYNWAGPNSFSNSNQNPTITNASTLAGGIYTVTVTDGNGCSATAQTTVLINTNPTATASSNSAICEGASLNLTSGGGTNYNWSGPNGFSNSSQNPTITNATTLAGGLYIVTVTNGNGCSSTAQTTVLINTNPTATASSNSAICEGATLNLTSGGGTNYSWNGPNSFSSTDQNPSISAAPTSANGNYTVTVTDGNGCSDSKSISVVINSLPSVSLSIPENTYCVYATPDTLIGNPAGGTFSGQGVNGNVFNPSAAGVGIGYQIKYTYTDGNGCTNSDSGLVSVNAMPVVDLQMDIATQIYNGQEVTFTANPTNYGHYDFYLNTSLMQSGSAAVYQSSALQNGQIIYVDATDNGCTTSDSIILDVKPIPNAFTPLNADGSNDRFLKGVDITVFNRWGQQLYTGKEGWDGKFNGANVSKGTYYFIIKKNELNKDSKEIKGSVTVVD